MTARPASLPDFDPLPHREALEGIVRAVAERIAAGDLDTRGFDGILRRYPRAGRGFFSRADIIAGYRAFFDEEALGVSEEAFLASVQRRPVRTQSGVTPLTLLTKPFPCPGKCVFCPNDVRMPKSYLADEPGAQRASANRFDPYLQCWNRLAAYRAIGHPTDKVEIIVLGGTWSFYPEDYQVWFATRCFEALNDFGAGVDARSRIQPSAPSFEALPARVDGREHASNPYNRIVQGYLQEQQGGELVPSSERAGWDRLEAAQSANESAGCRSVGFVVETRPDHVSEEEVLRIRRLGATKVQIGIQSLDDDVLAANRRGHNVEAPRQAVRRLRRAGFKIHAHWMPNLLGATPESDVADFARLFADPAIRPDELKVYPCSLVESAELMHHHARGEWRPYEHGELLDVLARALASVPSYCRVTRVIRDISSDDIVTGNKLTNFRQLAEQEVANRGAVCRDIRAREIRGDDFEVERLALRVTAYDADVSEEHFLEFVTPEDRIVGFLRLSLPREKSFVAELGESAVIREVHVYGASLGLGGRADDRAQHRGLGRRLVEEAARCAGQAGYDQLAVISAIGTRDWYRGLGFESAGLYQVRGQAP
ncbi:MAG: tRNA uridine(34) 5-carboxymethylaminomethyl modification radical SAM/GNAT enzyme Elp3 [Myxococcota bacterium]|nr:tRNA uridine(34) 5-carboxymethylaminomethyl modification radical SAM/GNAT enzyme Elp3 [Myxococcota bacterium]